MQRSSHQMVESTCRSFSFKLNQTYNVRPNWAEVKNSYSNITFELSMHAFQPFSTRTFPTFCDEVSQNNTNGLPPYCLRWQDFRREQEDQVPAFAAARFLVVRAVPAVRQAPSAGPERPPARAARQAGSPGRWGLQAQIRAVGSNRDYFAASGAQEHETHGSVATEHIGVSDIQDRKACAVSFNKSFARPRQRKVTLALNAGCPFSTGLD